MVRSFYKDGKIVGGQKKIASAAKPFDKITGERSIRLSFSSDFRIVRDAVKRLSNWFEENY